MRNRVIYLLKGGENPLILGVGALLALVIISTAIISTFSMRENSRQEWSNQLGNLTTTLAEQVSHTLFSANTVLNNVSEEIKASKIEDEKQFRDYASKEQEFNHLLQKTKSNPLIDVIALVDSHGEIANYSRSYPAPKVNVSDRDYFINARLSSSDETYYSTPVQNKFNQHWIFYLSKKVINSKGEFLGLIVIGISSELFSNYYQIVASNLGAGASISLYRKDFTVMARWPFIENMIGQKRADSTTMKIVDELKLPEGVILTNEASIAGTFIGNTRMVASRVVAKYPFIVSAEINDEVYTKNWLKNESWIWSSALAGLVLLVAAISLLLKANRKIQVELTERIAAQRELTKAHEGLETRVRERTLELSREVLNRKQAQEELARLNTYIAEVSHRAGMAEVANSVIHNVGNALNSINVAVSTINSEIRNTPLNTLPKISDMLKEHETNLAEFLTKDEKGQKFPKLLEMLSEQWKLENATLALETMQLQESVAHIREIVSRQQSLSGKMGIDENINISDLINNCLSFYVTNFKNSEIIVSMNNEPGLEWSGDRSKITQILLNLIMNSEESLIASTVKPKTLKISSFNNKNEGIQIEVADNGLGIEPEVLNKLFSYGFTTKPSGHGLGLHASAIAANEMGGSLQAFSSGKNKGATFILTLPKHPPSTINLANV